jgi:hypothetical protein
MRRFGTKIRCCSNSHATGPTQPRRRWLPQTSDLYPSGAIISFLKRSRIRKKSAEMESKKPSASFQLMTKQPRSKQRTLVSASPH